MSEHAPLPLDDLRRNAVQRDIRKQPELKEKPMIESKQAELALVKQELLSRVGEHLLNIQNMQHKQSDLALFKSELLNKVGEHLEDLSKMEHKQKELAQFKQELLSKVDEHIKVMEHKDDILKFKQELLNKVEAAPAAVEQ